jgi:predicted Zn-dependent peptidase
VQRFKLSILALQIIILTTIFPYSAWPQSGRGRPRVPTNETTAAPPQPVNVPVAAAVVKQEQVGNISRFALRNGMTVIITEQHATPIVASVAYFKAGAVDEPERVTAVARLIQRLIVRRSRAAAGMIAGEADYESSSYHFVASPDKLKDALARQASALQNPPFEPDEVRREIALAIQEERVFQEQSDYSMARLYNIAFGDKEIGRFRPTSVEALRSVTREQLLEFYKAHYRPDDLIISVAGDVLTFNTLVEIQKLYGAFNVAEPAAPPQDGPGKPARTPTPAADGKRKIARPIKQPSLPRTANTAAQPASPQQESKPAPNNQVSSPAAPSQAASSTAQGPLAQGTPAQGDQSRLRYGADRGDINQSIVSIGYKAPGLESKDWAAIETLTALVGRGRASRLNRSLIDAQLVAGRVESSYLPFKGAGLIAIQMWVAGDSKGGSSIDKAESAFFREVDAVRREIPTEGEMARAKALLEKRFVDGMATYLGRARALARAEASPGGFRLALDYRNQIRAVRAEDVQRVAAKYLTLANTAVHEYEPQGAAPRTFDAESFIATVTAWDPAFAQPVDTKDAHPADANSSIAPVAQGSERTTEQQVSFESIQPLPVKDFSTLNGPQAFVREEHALPTVAIALLFRGGRLTEDETTSGTTELMLRSMLYGTARRIGANIAQELDQLGADVQIVNEPDFFGFMLTVLSRNADRALKLLRDCIEDPAFREDDVRRARLSQVAFIRDGRDSSLARSRELLLQAIYPGHNYSLPPHGREEIVMKLASEQITEWHSRVIKRQLPFAIIVGDTNGSALVSSQLAEGFKRREMDKSLEVKVPTPKGGEKAEPRRRVETTVAIGFAGPKAESDDLIALELIEALMNGAGGRLTRELRDRQGLASEARLDYQAMFAAGVIFAELVTSIDNESRARLALVAELERLSREPVGADEMERARAAAIASRHALLQYQAVHALEYARAVIYKPQASEADKVSELLLKVTAEDVKRAANLYFKPSNASAGIVRGVSQPAAQAPAKQD